MSQTKAMLNRRSAAGKHYHKKVFIVIPFCAVILSSILFIGLPHHRQQQQQRNPHSENSSSLFNVSGQADDAGFHSSAININYHEDTSTHTPPVSSPSRYLRQEDEFYDSGLSEEEEYNTNHLVEVHSASIKNTNIPPSITMPVNANMQSPTSSSSQQQREYQISSRSLGPSSQFGIFKPLPCNVNLSSQSCSNYKVSKVFADILLTNNYSGSKVITIPCGLCYTWDLNGDFNIDGLNILGKLVFPKYSTTKIYTPYVIVQGQLQVFSNLDMIGPDYKTLHIVLVGNNDVSFIPASLTNKKACPSSDGVCNIGRKPFVVAGGTVDIKGLPSTCKTWTKVKQIARKKSWISQSQATGIPQFKPIPTSCQNQSLSGKSNSVDSHFIYETFENNNHMFSSTLGSYAILQNDGSFAVKQRKIYWQGPMIDYTLLKPSSCLEPNRDYLFTIRLKSELQINNYANKVATTTCRKTGKNCLTLTSDIGAAPNNGIRRDLGRITQNYDGDYGEYTYLHGSFQFSAQELSNVNRYWTFQINGLEANVNIIVDSFEISVPSPSSFHNPDDVCSELILNGDAEGNGLNPYPMKATDKREQVMVIQEYMNKFFRLSERNSYESSISSSIETLCMKEGVTYEISLNTRIQSFQDVSYSIYLRALRPSDGGFFTKTILNCEGQSIFDGWKSCSGSFVVDMDLSLSVSVSWGLVLDKNSNDDLNPSIDFDDVSISLKDGYVDRLLIDKDESSCWGSNSDVLVTSSTFYNFDYNHRNSFTTTMNSSIENSVRSITLKDIPYDPVIAENENVDFASEVALLGRNIVIEAANDGVEGKGGYFQILNTPNLKQVIVGVEFVNMGRRGESDRYAMQVLGSGSIDGSQISNNSFRNSNNWNVVLEETSNLKLAGNIVHKVYGHGFYTGFGSFNNLFYENLVSNSMNMYQNQNGVDDESSFASSFFNGPSHNHYIRNVASASEKYGFSFDFESKNISSQQVGTFRFNVVHSSGMSGIVVRNYDSDKRTLTFEHFKSFKNSMTGVVLSNSKSITLSNGLIAENLIGVTFPQSRSLIMENVNINGMSAVTKELQKSFYGQTYCVREVGKSPVGCIIPTKTFHQDENVNFVNVKFSDFESDDICDGSTPISFSDSDKDAGYYMFETIFKGVQFNDKNNFIDACNFAQKSPYFSIIDIDGASNPNGQSMEYSSIVQNTPMVKKFSSSLCKSYEDKCISYCEGTCFRSGYVMVDMDGTVAASMIITRTDDQRVVYTSSLDNNYHISPYNAREFPIFLSEGNYSIRFIDVNGINLWPGYVMTRWNNVHKCNDSLVQVHVVKPPATSCTELVQNGNFDKGTFKWNAEGGSLQIESSNKSDGKVMRFFNRSKYSDNLIQNLDTRCFQLSDEVGEFYEIEASMKLMKNNKQVGCTYLGTNESSCPSFQLLFLKYQDESEDEITQGARLINTSRISPAYVDDFHVIHGVIRSDALFLQAHRIQLQIGNIISDTDLVFRSISIKKMGTQLVCNSNLVRNGDFQMGNTKFWNPIDGVLFDIVKTSNSYDIKLSQTASSSVGMTQNLFVDCLVEKSRYVVEFSYKILKTSGEILSCNDRASDGSWYSCLKLSIQIIKNGTLITTDSYVEKDFTYGTKEMETVTGILVIDQNYEDYDSLVTSLSGTHHSHSLLVDYVSISPLPLHCSELILNHSFQNGNTAFWYSVGSAEKSIIKTNISINEYSLLVKRGSEWGHIRQPLDIRCLSENVQYNVNAIFMLRDTESNQFKSCDFNNRDENSDDHCPTVSLIGSDCDGDDEFLLLWNEYNLPQWIANEFNQFHAQFSVPHELLTCKLVDVVIGNNLPIKQELVIGSLQITRENTSSPTLSPSFPTQFASDAPSLLPSHLTSSPTSAMYSCPLQGVDALTVKAGMISIFKAKLNELCILSKVVYNDDNEVDAIIPIARSYDSHDWERSAGEVALTFFNENKFMCSNISCKINIPVDIQSKYVLSSYGHTLSERDEIARFLETATFGTTKGNIETLMNSGGSVGFRIAKWMKDEMNSSLSSHREYWRKRLNPRLLGPSYLGVPNHPCDPGSRWRKYAFVQHDLMAGDKKKFLRIEHLNQSKFILIYNNNFRTIVNDLKLSGYPNYTFDPNFEYTLCSVSENVGGEVRIRTEDGKCRLISNPSIDLISSEDIDLVTIKLPNKLDPVQSGVFSEGEEFIIKNGIQSEDCKTIPSVLELNSPSVFGLHPDGYWLIFDRRLNLQTNTLSKPIPDGGKAVEYLSGGATTCSNVPRTFLNEDTCVSSNSACSTTIDDEEIAVELNEISIKQLYQLTGRFVYGIKGLEVIDSLGNKLDHPCTPGLQSRWMKMNIGQCSATALLPLTQQTLTKLIIETTDKNSYVKDIVFPQNEKLKCDSSDKNPAIDIIVDNKCWRRVHPNFLSVYDMTHWAEDGTHPGNVYAANTGRKNPIKKWAWNGQPFLIYPASHPTSQGVWFQHPITRWDSNQQTFGYIGRVGDTIKIQDLPNELRTEAVVSFYSDKVQDIESLSLVCGSPGEVSNDVNTGFFFDASNEDVQPPYPLGENRYIVWMMMALSSSDQLRQRVAWALAQVLVVVESAIGPIADTNSECFLNYYDIFTRHAFGNYKDILKEVAYSPMMAKNLSYLRSMSAAYLWEEFKLVGQADENFAREIMQLFTIGLIKLNLDGTPKLSSDGQQINTYSNIDIMSISRVWTGFDHQNKRGNIEGDVNRLDPMKIRAYWRDRFPKSDLNGGYIGDYFPLCEDFPSKLFLRKGARFIALGSSPLPTLMNDPSSFIEGKRLILDKSSSLRNILCNPKPNGQCQDMNSVVLQDSVNCTGDECFVDTIRVVQVEENRFYEYVPPPCVQHVFHNDAKRIKRIEDSTSSLCGNPYIPIASEACCAVGQKSAKRFNVYDGERMTFSKAKSRCQNNSSTICDFKTITESTTSPNYFWTNEECQVKVKVNEEGLVAIVHDPGNDIDIDVVHYVDDRNQNWFRVYWDDEYPKPSTNCDGSFEVLSIEGNCLCDVYVTSTIGYYTIPKNKWDIMSTLKIGSLNPTIEGENNYSIHIDKDAGITTYLKGGVINKQTIFHVFDDKGREFWLKNEKQFVRLREKGGSLTVYSFRNIPHFMSLIPSEATVRDAQYETDATLDHLLYSDNTAPFLAIRLIQRLIMSNPSPRYVETVAIAFKKGEYTSMWGHSFGNGQYGDMSSTIAAIYLDREARSVILDVDPSYGSLREPLLKVLALMRSMEFTPHQPLLQLDTKQIGQSPYGFPSVFSFFLPEFKPHGRVSASGLVAPEGSLVDMSKNVGLLNGMFSLVNFGLTKCLGGFGLYGDNCNFYDLKDSDGILKYGMTGLYEVPFQAETFEGPSLKGGFDNNWRGFSDNILSLKGTFVNDPLNSSNHVMTFTSHSEEATIFSPPLYFDDDQYSGAYVVQFRYLRYSYIRAGGCIGYTNDNSYDYNFVYCDSNDWKGHKMGANGTWKQCQFELPKKGNNIRISLSDMDDTVGDAFFDDIRIIKGSGTMCSNLNIKIVPPGKVGYSAAVVDELATLLTAGRLDKSSRNIIRDAFDAAGTAEAGLKVVQQLILSTPAFHSTNIVQPGYTKRNGKVWGKSDGYSGTGYKAIVYLMLSGGCDSFNMLVPHTCMIGKDLQVEYMKVRQSAAISKEELLPISGNGNLCESFGIHPELPIAQKLYNDGDLAFFANAGVLTEPLNKKNYIKTNVQLFAHNHMQEESKIIDPNREKRNTGVLGRIAQILSKFGQTVHLFSLDRYSSSLQGSSFSPLIINSQGITPFHLSDDMKSTIASLNNGTKIDSGFFAETWSNSLMESIDWNSKLEEAVKGVKTSTEFPKSDLGMQLEMVSKLIRSRSVRNVQTDIFYVELDNFDHHFNIQALNGRFIQVNDAVKAFTVELKDMKLWDSVTTIQMSEFGRTLAPNSGGGTDHAWGGNYMIFGGSVAGGQVLGEYPNDFTDFGPLTLPRGRFIPTTSFDAIFEVIATWAGVPENDLNEVCPNRNKFPISQRFTRDDVFVPVPTESPSLAPSRSPSRTPSRTPSKNPSKSPSRTPSKNPSKSPSRTPSKNPSKSPSNEPTTSKPTSMPTIEFIPCVDNGLYKYNGIASQDCKWIGEDPSSRCGLYSKWWGYASQECKKSCGTCRCKDNPSFRIDGTKNKDCQWVKKMSGSRCLLPGASNNCIQTCNQPCCQDNADFRLNNVSFKNCEWVSADVASRCIKEAADACKVSCGRCKP